MYLALQKNVSTGAHILYVCLSCKFGSILLFLRIYAASPSGCGRISASYRAAGQVTPHLCFTYQKSDSRLDVDLNF